QYLLNAQGQVNGLLLQDNTIVRFSPQMRDAIVTNVHPGDTITALGFAETTGQVHATTIRNATNRRTISETTAPPPAAPDRQLVEASGVIRVVTRNPQGQIDGAVLTNGFVIHVPGDTPAQLIAMLQPGQMIAARGWGTINELGRSLDADAIGSSVDKL